MLTLTLNITNREKRIWEQWPVIEQIIIVRILRFVLRLYFDTLTSFRPKAKLVCTAFTRNEHSKEFLLSRIGMKWIPLKYYLLPGLTWSENRGAIEVCTPVFLWRWDQTDKSQGSSTCKDFPSEQECEWLSSPSFSYLNVPRWWFGWGAGEYLLICRELDKLLLFAWVMKFDQGPPCLYLTLTTSVTHTGSGVPQTWFQPIAAISQFPRAHLLEGC
jgi:hypothetical protein